ncbi:hypothetical protein GE061_015412 [Apolygus lucorum]|uniref:Uncharacterized protein n=1 Tax=Apolygus lucorum TaxID=248454 RepID=A0A8S9XL16_APOLU|nr:hypothetical protein GE061_015412 [Apolygus lucorum]
MACELLPSGVVSRFSTFPVSKTYSCLAQDFLSISPDKLLKFGVFKIAGSPRIFNIARKVSQRRSSPY